MWKRYAKPVALALRTRTWFPVAAAQLSGSAVGRILPGGSATAVAVSTSMLREAGIDSGEAAAAFGASTGLQLATRLALPVLALPAVLAGAPINHGLVTAAYLGLGVFVLLLAAGAAAFASDAPVELAGRWIQWLLNATVRRHRRVSGLPQELLADRDYIRALVSYWLSIPAGGAAYVLFRRRDDGVRAFRTRSDASRIQRPAVEGDSATVKTPTGRSPMESTFDRATKIASTQLTKMRWALGLNGLLSVAVGVVILVWPGISLFALTILVGAYALATGVIGLFAALRGDAKDERAWLVVSSLLGIAVGVIVLVWPDISALALLYVIGAYAVVLGLIAIYGAFALPLDGGDSALLGLSGLVSIVFGIVMFAKPGDGALVLLALIAAFALVTGITEIVVAIGAKRILQSQLKQMFVPKEPYPSST